MSTAAWVMAAFLAIGLLCSANKHGQAKVESFWVYLTGVAITVALLWWGGFWS